MLLRCMAVLAMLAAARALDNGLARTPPMGWMTWLGFGCHIDCKTYPKTCISENLIKRTADRMVADGYLAAGYEYVIIDDCWPAKNRTADNRLQADPERFPSGIKALADYVHSKGLKFGIYQDMGEKTCMSYPGIDKFGELDAQTFAEWGVDYVKIDVCFMKEKCDIAFPRFASYLNKTGRPILYSCSWPSFYNGKVNYTEVAKSCNIWRNYEDISANWNSVLKISDWFGDNQDRLGLRNIAGPGHFNDPDMLIAGLPKVSKWSAYAQMSVWAVLAAPLLMSVDLDTISQEQREVLLDPSVIAANQDPLGKQGKRIHHNETMDVWSREVVDGLVLAIYKRNMTQSRIELPLPLDQLPHEMYEVEDITEKDKPRKVIHRNSQFYAELDEDMGAKMYIFRPLKGNHATQFPTPDGDGSPEKVVSDEQGSHERRDGSPEESGSHERGDGSPEESGSHERGDGSEESGSHERGMGRPRRSKRLSYT